LRFVLQEGCPAVPVAAGHLTDVPLPGQVVPEVPAVEGDRRGFVPASETSPLLLRCLEARGFLDRRRRGIGGRRSRRRRPMTQGKSRKEQRLMARKRTTKADQPLERYPSIARWCDEYGWIEVGYEWQEKHSPGPSTRAGWRGAARDSVVA